MMVNGGATVTMEDCDFIDNVYAISNYTFQVFKFEDATIAQLQDTIVRLQHCEFQENPYGIELVIDPTSESILDREALIITDPYDESLKVGQRIKDEVDYGNLTEHQTFDRSSVPAERRGIDSTSSWLKEVQKVRFHSAISLATSSKKNSGEKNSGIAHSCQWYICTYVFN
jgi:hypothetical protein